MFIVLTKMLLKFIAEKISILDDMVVMRKNMDVLIFKNTLFEKKFKTESRDSEKRYFERFLAYHLS